MEPELVHWMTGDNMDKDQQRSPSAIEELGMAYQVIGTDLPFE